MAAVRFFDVHFISSSRVDPGGDQHNAVLRIRVGAGYPRRSGDLAYPTVGRQKVMGGLWPTVKK